MRKLRRALALTAAAACMAAATLLAPSAGGSTQPPSAGAQRAVVIELRDAHAEAAREFWTRARMRSARPYPMPSRAGGPDAAPSALQSAGEPRLVPGATPSGEVVGSDDIAQSPANASATAYAYPYPYTRTKVLTSYNAYPWRAVGKLFFVQNGGSFVCSAAAVQNAPGNKTIVWTAGHCVSDGQGHADTSAVFVPAYKNGNAPFGTFPATHLFTTHEWHNQSDFRYDFAALRVDKNAAGKTLYSKTGKLGFATNLSRVQHWNSFGYPAASPFTGELMINCQGSHALDDTTMGSPATIGIGCDMTGGSSGGPWIVAFGRGNYVNGVNSYGYVDEPEAMYSPFHGTGANQLRCMAAGTTC